MKFLKFFTSHAEQCLDTRYLSLYAKSGMEALLIRKQLEHTKFLTDEQEKELFHIISTYTPEEASVGIFANWTAPLVCCFVEKYFQVKFSERGMRALFYRIGLSYARPTYTLNNADPKKFLNGGIDVILFEGESMIRDYQTIMKNMVYSRETAYYPNLWKV